MKHALCSSFPVRLLLAAGAAVVASAHLAADTMLAITSSGTVFSISGTTGGMTQVGPSGFSATNSMARVPGGAFYVGSGGSNFSPANLITIDPGTGQGQLVGALPVNGDIRGLACDLDGTLIAVIRDTVTSRLYHLDPVTLSAVEIGFTGLVNVQALAIAPDGTLYAWDVGSTGNNGKGLVILSRADGSFTDVSAANGGDASVQSLGFDPLGRLFGLRQQLVRIDETTGATTPVGAPSANDFRGLEFFEAMSPANALLAVDAASNAFRVNGRIGVSFTLGATGESGFDSLARLASDGSFVSARGGAPGVPTEFFELDPASGQATLLASITIGAKVRALARDVDEEAVFAVLSNDLLSRITFNPPSSSVVGALPFADIQGLAFSPTGDLYAWSTSAGLLRASFPSSIQVNWSDVNGAVGGSSFLRSLSFDPNGNLIGAGDGLFDVNTQSGAITLRALLPFACVGAEALALPVVRAPRSYCASQQNSLGCVPRLIWTGTPSASQPAGFAISALSILGGKSGLLFYGLAGRNSAPFSGGTLCVHSPLRRTALQTTPGSGCVVAQVLDFNAHVASGIDPTLVAGVLVDAQYWSRDPAAPSTVNLTDALEFELAP